MENESDIAVIAEQKLTEYMEARRMRKTPERYEVLKAVCSINGIFTIEELADKMQETSSFIVSRATLFNTLKLLVDANLVIRHTLTRAAHYECNVSISPKVCLVCMDCGSVKKLTNPVLTNYLNEVKVRLFSIKQPVLYLHGLCSKCSQARKKKTNKKKKQYDKRKS